ncbi:hypothetical protein M9H77_09546 [Catharanthus roseus]|uniref:Uncharacterized protein n=1 Tax=Catharanthus roseus TaxID=4058 RepID=A0ACC0C1C7_CATRO|nr:hypothetical protein M9H77_09546 [Catharanthus roseus]
MRKRRSMASMTLDHPNLSLQISKEHQKSRVLIEEIDGLIRVYKDGYVERSHILPSVSCTVAPELCLTSRDVVIDKYTNIWVRCYIPKGQGSNKFPLLVYFHGGGFCVGSASWICYHEFLTKLSSKLNCLIMSVNYRLAPENRLPAQYDDGFKAILWLKEQALTRANEWFSSKCNFSNIFLAGDSAGANIAYNLAARLAGHEALNLKPLDFKGTILIQPFFGGESRTQSEKNTANSTKSALTLAASDTYWRLSLPIGTNRDHPWCNPTSKYGASLKDLNLFPTLVCISEMDILKDRNLEFCSALVSGGKKVEHFVYKGVGHAFQILNKSQLSQVRTEELICHIKNFISR